LEGETVKRRLGVAGGLLLVLVAVLPVWSWELSLTGEAEWRFRYISRTGPDDLFGNAEIAQKKASTATSIGLAGPQTLAIRVEGYSSKGSDAAYAEQRFFLYPEFKLNDAIRLRAHLTFAGNVNANYRGGGANWVTNPHYSGWTMVDSRDLYAGTGLAVPILRAFWATVRTPLGIVTIGTRPAIFGMGWMIHEQDSYARSLALIVPYGPFHFVLSQYLHDAGYQHTDPNDDRNARLTPYTIASGIDQNKGYKLNTAVAMRYTQGSLDCGALYYVISREGQHALPQSSAASPIGGIGTYQDDREASGVVQLLTNDYALGTAGTTKTPIYLTDGYFISTIGYFKYQHERFFLNAEYDCIKIDARRNGGRPISGFSQAWAAEIGTFAGPVKVTLAHFYRSGHDRRGGWINTQSPTGAVTYGSGRTAYVNDKLNHFLAVFLGGGDSPIRPYNFLMGLYGTGNNSYTSTGVCTYEDFLGLAARVDYAAAANLNLFAAGMRARRDSNTAVPVGFFNGTWAMGVQNNADQANSPGPGTYYGSNGTYPYTGRPVPNVPDNDLGWEITAGCDWKLLENMTWRSLFAYWQPGPWFKHAYQDLTQSTFIAGPPDTIYANLLGSINPSRPISPLIAFQSSFLFEF
jgi:hypothetical protein